MGTLYVSDLDGTLLRRNQQTSAYTNRVINQLVKQGLCFSYATARSYSTARLVTKGMVAAFPLIVYNGAFIRDNASGELLHTSAFEPCDAERIVRELSGQGVAPIVYEMIDGAERFSYLPDAINRQTAEFIALRQGDGRDRKVSTLEELLVGEVFYFT
ncbi:MAG: HAD family phosphatase [Atopobiaceae bacterium]|nr:HAD family phosphatase [Atopobiaceae bacterium]